MPATRAPFGSHWASATELKEQLEAERQGDPFLVFRSGEGDQRIVVLDGTVPTTMTVGRAPETDVCLGWDEEVSRVHAELVRVGPDWTVSDDGLSRNGTYVNGDRVSGRLRLRGGDVIRFGATPIAFRSPGAELGETASVQSGPAPTLSAAQRRVLVALCRPYGGRAAHAAPATNRQIAEELFLSIEGVKTHVRSLFEKFGVEDLPQNRKRARLVELAFSSGTITQRDLEEPKT
jgi:pSer/pThr/pTyr-binding forkhead associated (FHA) protein